MDFYVEEEEEGQATNFLLGKWQRENKYKERRKLKKMEKVNNGNIYLKRGSTLVSTSTFLYIKRINT